MAFPNPTADAVLCVLGRSLRAGSMVSRSAAGDLEELPDAVATKRSVEYGSARAVAIVTLVMCAWVGYAVYNALTVRAP